ncbi:hypothetical protein KFE25_003083 [Diacronema lutheri]|uniref:Fructose-bisphosphate aldolase n=1 Tax=Diacronema lutheri TaxID=2081491 RepID=A0A8J5X8G2_DIALT|nr:hypothetical protein KFE25_003083 [Diacronema lutheri]
MPVVHLLALCAAVAAGSRATPPRANAALPSIRAVTRGQKLTVGVEISHAELPPPPPRGYGVSIHHANLYAQSEEELRVLPIRGMSEKLRAARVSCVAVRGMGDLLTHVAAEQARARGEFPGPIAVVYEQPVGEPLDALDPAAVAAAGASAVLLAAPAALPCADAELDAALAALAPVLHACADAGLEAVVELAVSGAAEWDAARAGAQLARTEDVTACAALLLALRGDAVVPLPDALRGRVVAGLRLPWSQIDGTCDALRSAGYCGALLRSECMPMAAATVADWGEFWAGVVGSARSNKSKSVTVMVARQQKVNAMAAYVEKVKASGQFDELGEGSSLGATQGLDTARGDYVGF